MDRDDDGRLVDLMTIHNRVEAEIIRGVLAQEGIRTWAQTAPGPYMEFLGTNAFLPTLIRVRPGDEGAAREVLERNRQDSVDIDWSEVDVGEPMDPLAAEIGRRDESAISAGRRERSALSRTLRWMTFGLFDRRGRGSRRGQE